MVIYKKNHTMAKNRLFIMHSLNYFLFILHWEIPNLRIPSYELKCWDPNLFANLEKSVSNGQLTRRRFKKKVAVGKDNSNNNNG